MLSAAFPFGETIKQEGRFQLVAGNEPKNLPGLYGIYDLRNGKWCVGSTTNIRRRRHEHEGDVRKRTQLSIEISAAGPECFVYVPLYYFVVTRTLLDELEGRLIQAMDSVAPNGYNAFALRSEKSVWGVMHSGHDEAFFKRRAASITAHHQEPEYREAQRQDTSKRKWYNNGTEQRRIPPDEDVPDGWVRGRLPVSESYREKMRYISRESQNRPEVKKEKSKKARAQWERQSAILARRP